MTEIDGYHILEELNSSRASVIFRALNKSSGQKVILKFLQEDTTRAVNRYKQAYEICSSLNSAFIIKANRFFKYQENHVIEFEDFGAVSLNILFKDNRPGLKEFLNIALKICEGLEQIHKNNIIHKDINPSNIVFNQAENQLKITGFGISTGLTRENPPLKAPEISEGTLTYMSPEQTGRMNRVIDYRTDFYSLGITFYEILSGQKLFEGNDPLELIHAHIAREPVFTTEFNRTVPSALSGIIRKLIAKTVEDRYQSTWGIKTDLEKCLRLLAETNNIPYFSLAERDLPDKFCISQKLYGREAETESLFKAFEDVRKGNTRFVLVAGYSGIGKTSLVQEIYKPIARTRSYFGKGKFEQFQLQIPYSAIAQACSELISQMLGESDNAVKNRKIDLINNLGANARLIAEVVPDLEVIIGPQPAVTELNSTESQNRFQITFINFIKVFSSRERPLVIFLDDLQWADTDSLALITALLQDKDLNYLFLLGTYRSNEVNEQSPLLLSLTEIEKTREVRKIFLNPLDETTVNMIISDTLKKPPGETIDFSRIIYNKTSGNPFFVSALLQEIYKKQIITFDFNHFCWQWNQEKIEKMAVSENVAELILEKLKQCSPAAIELLKITSCLGSTFDLRTLLLLMDPVRLTVQALREVIETGAVISLENSYRELKFFNTGDLNPFLLHSEYKYHHDKVQQAAYLLNEKAELGSRHLSLGKRLLQNLPEKEREIRIIDIVRQLNKGKELIDNDIEKTELAGLNLKAGIKAKLSAAYRPALEYFSTGINILPADCWDKHYNLTFALYKSCSECAYICGEFEKAEENAGILINKAASNFDKAEIFHLQAVQYTTMQKLAEAVSTVRKGLKLLGTDLQDDYPESFILQEMQLINSNNCNRIISALLDNPEISSPENRLTVRLLQDIFLPAYSLGLKNLLAYCVLKAVNICLEFGNVPETAYIFNIYAFLLGHIFGDLKTAYEFGKLATRLNEKFNDARTKTVNLFSNITFVQFWNHISRECVEGYKKVIASGLENGDLIYTSYACTNIVQWDTSLDLKMAVSEGERYLKLIKSFKFQDSIDAANIFQHLRLNLTGKTNGLFSLSSEEFDEEAMLLRLQKTNNFLVIALYHIYKIQPCYLYGDYQLASEHIMAAEKYIEALAGQAHIVDFTLFSFLTTTALYPEMNNPEKAKARRRLETELEMVKRWSDNMPDNFRHLEYLMEAEMKRLAGEILEADDLYKKAIILAGKNSFMQHEALANELAGGLWLGIDKEDFAKIYLKKARYNYQVWGAERKIAELDNKYPYSRLIKPLKPSSGSSPEFGLLDIDTIKKSSQALLTEKNLEALLEKMIKLIIKNGGAEKGIILLPKKEQWFIEAEYNVNTDFLKILQSVPVSESSESLPNSVLNYVTRTRQSLILNNIQAEEKFINDPYVMKVKPLSVLCLPLINQGQVQGVLYLENNLTADAFTEKHLEMLGFLSVQAAIALENTILYGELEQRVKDRTADLLLVNNNLKALNQEKNELLDIVTHNLKSPLAGVVGFASSLNQVKDLTKKEVEAYSAQILAGGKRMLGMIDNLLDVNAIEEGNYKLNFECLDIVLFIEDLLMNYSDQLKAKQLKLEQLKAPESIFINTDEGWLAQILDNLLSNAIKFSPYNKIILIQIVKVSEKTQIRVIDQGPGLNENDQQRLFQKFARLSAQPTGGESSSGLGLSIAKKMVEILGGKIFCESPPGKGATFIIEF